MKLLKLGIRFWITIASVVSFVGGWIMLVHSPKPYQGSSSNNNITPLPTLEPLQPLSNFGDDGNSFQNQPLFSVQPQTRSRSINPFFRTGGS